MDQKLTFENQVINLRKKLFHTLRNLSKVRYPLDCDQMKLVVNSMVLSCLDYCNGLYFGIAEKHLKQLQILQNSAAKLITGKRKFDHVGDDLVSLHWLHVKKRIIFKIALLAYKAVNGFAPVYLQDMFRYSHHGHALKLITPSVRSRYGKRSFSYVGPKIYNNLPTYITSSENTKQFKVLLKTLSELPRLLT